MTSAMITSQLASVNDRLCRKVATILLLVESIATSIGKQSADSLFYEDIPQRIRLAYSLGPRALKIEVSRLNPFRRVVVFDYSESTGLTVFEEGDWEELLFNLFLQSTEFGRALAGNYYT